MTRIIRFESYRKVQFGRLEKDYIVGEDRIKYIIGEVNILPPVSPSKIICIGFNYAKHRDDAKKIATKTPTLTLKSPNSIIMDGATIELPPDSKHVEHEAELGVVVGKAGYNIENPAEHIAGYLPVNDVTARDIEMEMVQWSASKSFPTFCPVGGFIETDADPKNLNIECRVNGKLRQQANTSEMIYDAFECVRFASSFMKLEVGDLICTGTPAGVGKLKNGDVVEVNIFGVGSLKNQVKK
ncbi:MAG: hypothetical protein MSIBF_01565 [Candidatus Altiarchaeales archaeon IMC4]|nr:MAG: hypothetical protein MSIBF_01565 [Candidatus Altiarchaeales archaeon IMC4]